MLHGRTTGPAVFYMPPETVNGPSEQAIVRLRASDEQGRGALEEIRFSIVSNAVISAPPRSSRTSAIKLHVETDKDVYYEHDEVIVRITADRDCYIRIYSRNAAGQEFLVFPNEWRQDNFIKAGQSISIPDASDQFVFQVEAPFGTETLKVEAGSTQFEELENIDWAGRGFSAMGFRPMEQFKVSKVPNHTIVSYEVRPRP